MRLSRPCNPVTAILSSLYTTITSSLLLRPFSRLTLSKDFIVAIKLGSFVLRVRMETFSRHGCRRHASWFSWRRPISRQLCFAHDWCTTKPRGVHPLGLHFYACSHKYSPIRGVYNTSLSKQFLVHYPIT